MAARGAWSKEQVTNKILETFTGAFINDKEIRVPMIENGERVEIKITLTCAKTNVGGSETEAAQGEKPAISASTEILPPSEEEKEQVKNLLAKLGL